MFNHNFIATCFNEFVTFHKNKVGVQYLYDFGAGTIICKNSDKNNVKQDFIKYKKRLKNYLNLVDNAKPVKVIFIEFDQKHKGFSLSYVNGNKQLENVRKTNLGFKHCIYMYVSHELSKIPSIRFKLIQFKFKRLPRAFKNLNPTGFAKRSPTLPSLPQYNFNALVKGMEIIGYKKYRLGKNKIMFLFDK